MNLQKLMAEAKKMQANIDKKISEFDEKEFDFSYKNYVQIKIKGSLQIIKIDVDKQLIDPDDKTMLEEMIAEAINEAILSVSKEKEKITQSVMPKMPF